MIRFLSSILVLLALAGVVIAVLPPGWGARISEEPRSMAGSGFINGYPDVGPGTWAWSGFADLRVDHPAETNIVIWNHHTEAMMQAPSCHGSTYFPPPSIMALERIGRTRVFYLCTKGAQADGWRGYFETRRAEILALVRRLRALGVPAGRIFLSGQSGGSCSSLLALGAAPADMNAGILFATACAGRGEGLLREAGRLGPRGQAMDRMVLSAPKLTALLVTFENDTWNKPRHLAYLRDAWPGTVRIFSPGCGANHGGAFHGCGLPAVEDAVRAYFLERLQAHGLGATGG